MTASIYRSQPGQAAILSLYDRVQADIGLPFDERYVPTRFGRTHVLVTGPEEAPPLVIFQGGNVVSPSTLGWFRPLLERFRVYAPDTVGHPGRSAQTRISPRDNSFAHWACDLLDGLGLEQTAVLGHSYGGGIILQLAAVAPQRIAKAVIMMPAGVVMGPLLPMLLEVLVPTLRYQFRPDRAPLYQLVSRMSTGGEVDEQMVETVGAVFRHVKLEHGFPRKVSREELAGFAAPALVLAGECDPFFPGDRVVSWAEEQIPNLAGAESLPGCSHFPSAAMLEEINQKIAAFLEA